MTLLTQTLLALAWANENPQEIVPVLEQLPNSLGAARSKALAIAPQLCLDGKLFLLGAGPERAAADYGAAKFHEAGGLIAIAAETENFIHGMNFMVEPQDTLLALAGNGPSRHRGQEIIANFSGFVRHAGIIEPDGFIGGRWQKAFADMLSTTFILQNLCLTVAGKAGLAVEQPRAGRANGDTHLAIQSRIMAL